MSIADRNVDGALLVLRVAVALVFIAHGCVKLFVIGHELEFLLACIALTLAFAGGGAHSFDARLAARKSGSQ